MAFQINTIILVIFTLKSYFSDQDNVLFLFIFFFLEGQLLGLSVKAGDSL